MKALRNILLVLLSIILVFLIPAAISVQTLNTTILKPYNTEQYIAQSGIYQEAESYLRETLNDEAKGINLELGRPVMMKIVNRVVDEQLTSDWISNKIAYLEKTIWDYVLDKSDTIQPIPMAEFRNSFLKIAETEIDQYAKDEGIPVKLIKNDLLESIKKNVPEQYDFVSSYNIDMANINKFKNYYNDSVIYSQYLYITIAILVVLGALLAFRIKRILKWAGITFIVGSVIALIPASATYIIKGDFLLSKVSYPDTLERFVENAIKLFKIVLNDVGSKMLVYSLIVFSIGLVILIFSGFVKEKAVSKEEQFYS